MKWIKRDPWSDAFRDVLDRHLGPACEKADIEIDELADIVGAEWVATLWGCAFEDFLTRDLEEAGNIVEDYLKRRGWNEKAPNKAYLRGLRASVMSLHEVSDVKPGKSCMVRDLFLGGDPIQITERSATQSLKQWDRIAARVAKTRRGNVIGGGLLPLDRDLSEILLESLERVQKHSIEEGNEVLRDIAPEISGDDVEKAFDRTEVLRMAAPLITTFWLTDLLDETLNPRLPELRNAEGEEMVFLSLHYRLRPGVSATRVRDALNKLPDLRAESATFWNWLAPGHAPSGYKPTKTRSLTFVSTMDDGSLVVGTLELKGGILILSVNSEGRAERGRAMLAPVLDGMVQEPLIERQEVGRSLGDHAATEDRAPTPPPEDAGRIVHESLDTHYRRQIDEPIPLLGDVSPREAATSTEGREKLVAWLKGLENHMAGFQPPDPMANYDVTWLWDELGVADLRR